MLSTARILTRKLSTVPRWRCERARGAPDAVGMPTELPRECLRLLKDQGGVITIGQAVSTGLPAKGVRDQVRAGRWQVMQRGVYAAFTGRPTREAELWAALLRAGPAEAVLSHQTAAELWGLLDGPSRVIHVTVPHDSNPERRGQIPGAVVHRSRSLQHARHPVAKPPRTRVEETVLDLVDCARSFEEAYGWICCAIGRRRTTAARIRVALLARPRIQWTAGCRAGSWLRQGRRALRPRIPLRAGRRARPWAAHCDTAGAGPACGRQSVPGQPLCGIPRLRRD